MPLKSYGVLVGRAVDRSVETDLDTPHYQVRMEAAGSSYRVAVNVRSSQSPPDLLYQVIEDLEHPMLAPLAEFTDGFHVLPSAPGGVALDYIRQNLVDRDAMRTLPSSLPGPDNDLADRIDHFVTRAIADPEARVYAFGERWGPEQGVADKVFDFLPGNGVHDVHMNQGNDGPYVRDDGVWQDGGLLLHFPGENRPDVDRPDVDRPGGERAGEDQWVGIFLAFQSQAWHTDDVTGHRIVELPGGAGDGRVRIVGALVNPVGPAPEREVVTLLNSSDADISLAGWTLADRLKNTSPLPSVDLAAGAVLQVEMKPPATLGNKGGLITLLDPTGLKVHGVAYTQVDAREGWTVVF